MRILKQILILFFITFLISNKSLACDCKTSRSLKEIQNTEFKKSKYIFIGEVLKFNTQKNTFEIKVIESFKGALKGKVYRGFYNQWCEPIIDKSGKWLIYADSKSDNLIQIRSCGLTRSFKNPEENISATRVPNPPSINQTEAQTKKIRANWKNRTKLDFKNEINDLRIKTK